MEYHLLERFLPQRSVSVSLQALENAPYVVLDLSGNVPGQNAQHELFLESVERNLCDRRDFGTQF